jgi:hypothetical protein
MYSTLVLVIFFLFSIGADSKSTRYYEIIRDINEKKNYYTILGLDQKANSSEYKRAHKVLVLKYHPDKNKDPESLKIFLDVQRAFEILSDNETKLEYDTLLTEGIPMHEQYYGRYMHKWGAPQHDIRYVLLWTFVILTIAKYLYQRHRHYDMIDRAKSTKKYLDAQKEALKEKEKISKIGKKKTKKEVPNNKEIEAEQDISVDGDDGDLGDILPEVAIEVKGAPLPTWQDLLPVQIFYFIIYFPQNSFNWLIFFLAAITGQKPWHKTPEELAEERRIKLGMSPEEWKAAVTEAKRKHRQRMNSTKAKQYQRMLKKQNK